MAISVESLFGEKVRVFQPVEGYRMNLDTVILAAHLMGVRAENLLDVGCGCGILGALMLKSEVCKRYTGIEIQRELAECAEKTLFENRARSRIICGDIREYKRHFRQGEFELIVSNPPFYKKGRGRVNPHESKARARHEIDLTAAELFAAVKYLMPKTGMAFILYPAERTKEIIQTINETRLGIASIRFIHPFANRGAESTIFKVVSSQVRELKIEPPFILFEDEKVYSEELRDYLNSLPHSF